MTKFVVYEKVAEAAFRQFDKSKMSDGQQTLVNLGSGLMAGFAAAIVSQPADTMLSRMNKTKGLPGESTISVLRRSVVSSVSVDLSPESVPVSSWSVV